MLKSIMGTKVGMTQIFDEIGRLVPVTVVAAGPCIVSGVKTTEKDGYTAIVLAYGDIKEKSVSKPLEGQFKKNNLTPKKYLREFFTDKISDYQIGQEIKADIFKPGAYVDVSGVTKGKGFAGVMKRHNFSGGQATHGQSDRARAPGSIGGQGPQRVLKGLRMAGHLGHENGTIQKLEIVAVDPDKNYILIKGAVPGPKGGLVIIEETVKRKKFRAAEVKVKSAKAAKKKPVVKAKK